MKKNLVGLIDADFIKYLVAYDIERMFKGGLSLEAIIPYNTICDLTEKRIKAIKKETAKFSKDYLFLFSGKTSDNFRSLVASVKKYKGNRKYTPKFPKEGEYKCMVERYIEENYNYHKEKDLEADDLCIMGHSDGTYIYSKDKDLAMSPGVHYNTYTKKWINTTAEEGFTILMTQVLSGDSVDHIAGAEKIGKVNAKRIVAEGKTKRDVISKVISTFTEKHGEKDGLDRFVEMYTLINLKTDRGDWTKEKYSDFFDKLKALKNGNNDELTLF